MYRPIDYVVIAGRSSARSTIRT